MRKKMIRLLTSCLFIAILSTSSSAFLHRSAKNIVDSQGKTFIIKSWGPGEWMNIENYFLGLPGADVGTPSNPTYSHTAIRNKLNQLMGTANADTFYARWTKNIITEADVAQYAGWGINALRISMNYHWLSSADGVYIPGGFAMLDSVVAWGARYGVYIILAMHAAPGGQNVELMSDVSDGNPRLWNDSATYQPWTIHLWTYIAQRYADREWVGGYDLFDEPIIYDASKDPQENDDNTAQNKILLAFYKRLAPAIRAVDKNHMLFVESAVGWSTDFTNLSPIDSNMAWDFHDYNFDNANVNSYSSYYTVRNNTGYPLFNGEFGENNNAWAQNTKNQCETNNIGWCWWTTKKLGDNTQAYTIATPANFGQITSAFGGNSSLTQTQATTIMFALAENAKTEKCTKNCGIITALGLNCSAAPAKPLVTSSHSVIHSQTSSNDFTLHPFTNALGIHVSFSAPAASPITLSLFDNRGVLQSSFIGSVSSPGLHTILLSPAKALPSGIYHCILYSNNTPTVSATIVLTR